jgi:hypothetical protein
MIHYSLKEIILKPTGRAMQIQKDYEVASPTSFFCVPERNNKPEILDKRFAPFIMAVKGTSGGGKTSTLRMYEPDEKKWVSAVQLTQKSKKESLISSVHEDYKTAQNLLREVGLNSIPTWMMPYAMASTGQKFRANLTQVLVKLDEGYAKPIVVDEFGSVVDPTTRSVASYVLSKAIRKRSGRVILAINDHRMLDWIQPDVVFDVDKCAYMFTGQFFKQHEEDLTNLFGKHRLQEGPMDSLKFDPLKVSVDLLPILDPHERRLLWARLRNFHYLSHTLSGDTFLKITINCPKLDCGDTKDIGILSLKCLRLWKSNQNVSNKRVAGRFVIHPTFQGINLGPNILECVGKDLADKKLEFRFITTHPGLVKYFETNPLLWEEYLHAEKSKNSNRILHKFKWVGGGGDLGRKQHASVSKECYDCHNGNLAKCHGHLNLKVVLPSLTS